MATGNATSEKSARPTNKWLAARVTAVVGVIILFITTDNWDDEEWVATVTLIGEAIASYLTPNASTPSGDGVPARS